MCNFTKFFSSSVWAQLCLYAVKTQALDHWIWEQPLKSLLTCIKLNGKQCTVWNMRFQFTIEFKDSLRISCRNWVEKLNNTWFTYNENVKKSYFLKNVFFSDFSPSSRSIHVHSTCQQRDDGPHADPTDCTAFIHCAHGIAYKKYCPPKTAWDDRLKYCDFAENVTPPCKVPSSRAIGGK